MSFHRANVIWQSKDGTWNIGFYAFMEDNLGDPDRDPEWDVTYDHDSFWWASTGHTTKEAAARSWRGANPGSAEVLAYKSETAEECARYDEMVWALNNPEAAERKRRREERAALKKKMTEAGLKAGDRVRLTVRNCYVFDGILTEENGWLVLLRQSLPMPKGGFKAGSLKVQNLNTKAPGPHISEFSKVETPTTWRVGRSGIRL